MVEKKVNGTTVRLMKGDITDMEVEAFVYYARPDLKLGTGWGGAIAVRGGPSVQEQLNKFEGAGLGEAVLTEAGRMKAKYIIHAVGPQFQVENQDGKLRDTILAAAKVAEEKGIKQLAFPAMGAGFYGVPLDMCCKVMLDTLKGYLGGDTSLEEVIVCVNDNREYKPFQAQMATL